MGYSDLQVNAIQQPPPPKRSPRWPVMVNERGGL